MFNCMENFREFFNVVGGSEARGRSEGFERGGYRRRSDRILHIRGMGHSRSSCC